MSFIVTVLHRDSGLLVVNRGATTDGRVARRRDDTTISAKNGTAIPGLTRPCTLAEGSVLRGMTGNPFQHMRLMEFETSRDISEAIPIAELKRIFSIYGVTSKRGSNATVSLKSWGSGVSNVLS
jgi:hypothetical protein